MKRLLKGGSVVSGAGAVRADLLLDGETVAAVGLGLSEEDARVEDVSGRLLLPGFVDAHTHFDLDVAGTTTADDFFTGSRSALRGGTTSIIDFACPNKGESLRHGLELWHKKAGGQCACDYGFHMTVDDWNESIRDELPAMFAAGISSFKMYMTYPAMMIGDRALFEALAEIHSLGGLCGVHCENSGVIDALAARKKAAGELSPASHPLTRPAALEGEAVGRLLRMAEVADCSVMIVHLSGEAGLAEVRAARKRGQYALVETCPQYLFLDDSRYFQEDYSQAARYVCAPPLRKPRDIEALRRALADGEIQTVSTDHCSFTLAQKELGREDFTKIPGGLPGVETRGVLLLTLCADRKLGLGRAIQLLAENPAKLYGLWGKKGALAPGFDADVVVYNPQKPSSIRAKDQLSNAGYSPYEGFRTAGTIERVYLRGEIAVRDGAVSDTAKGNYMKRGKPQWI